MANINEDFLNNEEFMDKLAERLADKLAKRTSQPHYSDIKNFWKQKFDEAKLKLSKDTTFDKIIEQFQLDYKEIEGVVNRLRDAKIDKEIDLKILRQYVNEELGENLLKYRKTLEKQRESGHDFPIERMEGLEKKWYYYPYYFGDIGCCSFVRYVKPCCDFGKYDYDLQCPEPKKYGEVCLYPNKFNEICSNVNGFTPCYPPFFEIPGGCRQIGHDLCSGMINFPDLTQTDDIYRIQDELTRIENYIKNIENSINLSGSQKTRLRFDPTIIIRIEDRLKDLKKYFEWKKCPGFFDPVPFIDRIRIYEDKLYQLRLTMGV